MKWSVVYEKAIRDDGTLLFPKRLTQEFLEGARRTMGSYLFANQYQNEILPADDAPFKKDWLRYYKNLPEQKYVFGFVDPAISQEVHADFTAITIVEVDPDQTWYLKYAQRHKINPTQLVNLLFKLHDQFQFMTLGIEEVAYQKALLYMLDEEMRRRGKLIPIRGIHPGTSRSKEARIMGLVPRFEFGRILMSQGLHDFESEFSQFPRGSHDDLLDSLSQMEQIILYPRKVSKENERPQPQDPRYESWYIKQLASGQTPEKPSYDYGDPDGQDY